MSAKRKINKTEDKYLEENKPEAEPVIKRRKGGNRRRAVRDNTVSIVNDVKASSIDYDNLKAQIDILERQVKANSVLLETLTSRYVSLRESENQSNNDGTAKPPIMSEDKEPGLVVDKQEITTDSQQQAQQQTQTIVKKGGGIGIAGIVAFLLGLFLLSGAVVMIYLIITGVI